jgi:hypothetical protein
MTDHAIGLCTLALTTVGLVIAAGGVFYAIKTLRENTKIAQAQFFVSVRQLAANYDDVHANVRPGGTWAPHEGQKYGEVGPQNAAEWARVELYMGMFEYCEKLIHRNLLGERDFSHAYVYRLRNLLSNAVIVEVKLHLHKDGWQDFYRLCQRFHVHIPSPDELSEARDAALAQRKTGSQKSMSTS